MQLIALSKEQIAFRNAIDRALNMVGAIPIQGNSAETVLKVIVNNPHSNLGRIDIGLNGDELVEGHTVLREPGFSLSFIQMESGEYSLSVKWSPPTAFSFVDMNCILSHEE